MVSFLRMLAMNHTVDKYSDLAMPRYLVLNLLEPLSHSSIEESVLLADPTGLGRQKLPVNPFILDFLFGWLGQQAACTCIQHACCIRDPDTDVLFRDRDSR